MISDGSGVMANERQGYWSLSCGLQAVDGLTVSKSALLDGDDYVAGTKSATEVYNRSLDRYSSHVQEGREAEADVVAAAMLVALEDDGFSLSPIMLDNIHARIFEPATVVGFDRRWVGRHRTVNITKSEPVLGGRSVTYADWRMISDQLRYDFSEERRHCYGSSLNEEFVRHFSRFIANIWQTHAFREGNTRTVALFSQKYLRYLGVRCDNMLFMDNSLFYRDALVRANFSNLELGIAEDLSFLNAFYENLVLDKNHNLSSYDLNLHGIRVDEDLPYRTY